MEDDEGNEGFLDIEVITKDLLAESRDNGYPTKKVDIRHRYRNASYELHKKWKEQGTPFNFLSFGSRRSSTVSTYGNTPIVMRRSISSNGELAPYAVQAAPFGSLRGPPPGLLNKESKFSAQFGSLRGLPIAAGKRLSKFDEQEEEQASQAGQNDSTSALSDNKDGLNDGKRSHDTWDTASVDAAGGTNRVDRNKEKLKKAGFFRRNVKQDPQSDKDKWRDHRPSVDHSEFVNAGVKGEFTQNINQEEVRKSSESLISVRKKKHWWFRQKKSVKDSEILPIVDQKSSEDNDLVGLSERITLSDKAVSDINLKMPGPDDSRSLHEELRRSQILLKGYSQRTVAGMSLSNRLSGANQSVTSRGSLTGSDILISESSKSFMQYELPRTREPSTKGCSNSMADRIREGQTYEEQFETSLGSASRISAQSSEALLEDMHHLHGNKDDNRRPLSEVAVRGTGAGGEKARREGVVFNKTATDDVSTVAVDSTRFGLARKPGGSVENILDQLQETNIDEGPADKRYGSLNDRGVLIAPPQLSPDSRPIRPLQVSTTPPTSPSPPMLRHQQYSALAPGHESYPHSLLDRPVGSRLLAKRLSVAGAEQHEEAQDEADVFAKKSNIAYTLTFHKEPICVNVRTRSQSVTPEPYSTTLAHDGVKEHRKNSLTKKDNEPSIPEQGHQQSIAVGFERQLSSGDDRETSPGYRLAYDNGPMRSPTPPRRSLRKNPKVVREKDRLAMAVTSSPVTAEEGYFRSAQSSPISPAPSSPRKQNGDFSRNNTVTKEKHYSLGSDDGHQDPHVHTIKVESNDYHEELENDVFSNDGEIPTEEGNHEDVDDVEQKSSSKLQRRNTFTLPKSAEPLQEDDKGLDIVTCQASSPQQNGNQHSGEMFKLVIDGTVQSSFQTSNNNVLNSPDSSENEPPMRRLTPLGSDQEAVAFQEMAADRSPPATSPNLNRDNPNLGQGAAAGAGGAVAGGVGGSRIPLHSSRIPVHGRSSGSSRIPMMTGHASSPSVAATPERSSMRKKKHSGSVSTSGIPGSWTSGIPGMGSRKGSVVEGSAAARIGATTSPMTDNFMKAENNTIVVKRETFLQIGPEFTSTICSVM